MRKTYYEDCPNCGRLTTSVLYGEREAIEKKIKQLKQRFDNKEVRCWLCNAPLELIEKE
jgi:uncharacterized protein with PIN domain